MNDGPLGPDALFDHYIAPYIGQLLGTAIHYTRDRTDAQAVLQETLAKAYAALHQYEPGTNLQAWLHRILRTTHINMVRKHQRRPTETNGELINDLVADTAPAGSAEDHVINATLNPRLSQALDDLPTGFRQVLHLADVEGYAYAEIATSMNIPLGTVMSRLHRARRLLRHKLTTPDPTADQPPTPTHHAA